MDGVTELINDWAAGDSQAGQKLLPLIYDELKKISSAQLRRMDGPITLQATELINEAYIRLNDQRIGEWQNRAHFFAMAATVIRRVLLDHARYRLAARRSRRADTPIEQAPVLMSEQRAEEITQLDEALTRLAEVRERQANVVVLRYFGGLSIKETGMVMDIAPATVKRDWVEAKAWLYSQLQAAS